MQGKGEVPHVISALVILGFIALIGWGVARPESTIEVGPTLTGDLKVVRVIGGRAPGRRGPGSSELLVRLPSGTELPASLREFLPVGEHVWAVYSVSESHRLVLLHTYVRCGPCPCPQGARP